MIFVVKIAMAGLANSHEDGGEVGEEDLYDGWGVDQVDLDFKTGKTENQWTLVISVNNAETKNIELITWYYLNGCRGLQQFDLVWSC